jgi:hypothetical protein
VSTGAQPTEPAHSPPNPAPDVKMTSVCAGHRVVVGLPGLEPGTSSLSGFCPQARFPRMAPSTWANDLPLETAEDRYEPLGSDGMWTKRGPGTPARGAATLRRRTLAGKADPADCPRQASPATAIALLGEALAGSGPGTSPCIDGLSLVTGIVVPGVLLVQTMRTTMAVLKHVARRGRCKARPTDPFLVKPDRAGSSPAMDVNGAGRGRWGLSVGVRWGPVGPL